jgi:hypothetical protein
MDKINFVWNAMGLKVKLNEPGPQFLCFLEWERNERHANEAMDPVPWVPNPTFDSLCGQ